MALHLDDELLHFHEDDESSSSSQEDPVDRGFEPRHPTTTIEEEEDFEHDLLARLNDQREELIRCLASLERLNRAITIHDQTLRELKQDPLIVARQIISPSVDPETFERWNKHLLPAVQICYGFTPVLSPAQTTRRMDQLRARVLVDFASSIDKIRGHIVDAGFNLQMALRDHVDLRDELPANFDDAQEDMIKDFEEKLDDRENKLAAAASNVTRDVKRFLDASTSLTERFSTANQCVADEHADWPQLSRKEQENRIEHARNQAKGKARSDQVSEREAQVNAAIQGCLDPSSLRMLNGDDDYAVAWSKVWNMMICEMRLLALQKISSMQADLTEETGRVSEWSNW